MTQPSPSPIALLTDFGTTDAYVGTMKGAILRLCPGTPLIDLTHDIAPQNVRQAAFVLWTAYRYFPADAIFLAVVDPGVGSARHAIAVETAQGRFVGPDNGVFSDVLAEMESWRAVAIEPKRLGLKGLSYTFHGRDLFAPAAARLARGDDLTALGSPVENLLMLEPPHLSLTGSTIEGEVIYIDHFGNVVTSVGRCFWQSASRIMMQPRLQPDATPVVFLASSATLYIGPHTFTGIVHTYTQAPPGQAVLLINSAGQLEIAVNQGSARQSLGLSVGERVVVRVQT